MWNLRRSDGTIAPGWYLLPLRLFLGVTFLVAGVQKLANPTFFRASDPTGIHAQLAQAHLSSPIGGLVGHLEGSASALGVIIAIGEIAIGLGTIVGLWSRIAAGAGMLLSFSLFLTVSYHSAPYYTGSDIVFLFAWTPLVLAGAAGAPAIDTWLAGRAVPRTADGVVPDGEAEERPGTLTRGAVLGGAVLGTAAVAGIAVGAGRAAGGTETAAPTTTTPSTTTPTTSPSTPTTGGSTTTAPHGKEIATPGQVPVGGSATFTDPSSGDPGLILQPATNQFVAYDAVCPHEGCTVGWSPAANLIVCPCHGSEFNPDTGAVVRGPAPHGLGKIKVTTDPDGAVYLT